MVKATVLFSKGNDMYFLVYSNETGNLVDILYSAEELQRKFHPEQVTVHVIHV
jgi:hypothetical protein